MEIVSATQEFFNSSIVTVVISLVSLAFIVRYFLSSKASGGKTPPSPLGLPIIGHLHLLGALPHRSLDRLAQKFGPLFRIRLGSVEYLVANSSSAVRSILKDHESGFYTRVVTTATLQIAYGGSDMTFNPDELHWRFMRKLTMTELLGGRSIDLLHGIRREEIQRFMKGFFDKSRRGDTVNLGKEFFGLASTIVSRMSVGRQWAGRDDELQELKSVINEIEQIIGAFDLRDHIWVLQKLGIDLQGIGSKAEKVRARYDQMVERVLREKAAERETMRWKENGGDQGTVKDILDMLMDAYEDEKTEKKLTKENLKGYILVSISCQVNFIQITVDFLKNLNLSQFQNRNHKLKIIKTMFVQFPKT